MEECYIMRVVVTIVVKRHLFHLLALFHFGSRLMTFEDAVLICAVSATRAKRRQGARNIIFTFRSKSHTCMPCNDGRLTHETMNLLHLKVIRILTPNCSPKQLLEVSESNCHFQPTRIVKIDNSVFQCACSAWAPAL